MRQIRQAGSADLDAIIAVCYEASRTSHKSIANDYWFQMEDEMRELRIPESECHVCEDDGNIVGFVAFVEDDVLSICVDPTIQRSGIGSQLIAIPQGKQKRLKLEVFSENTSAIRFYVKNGFEVIDSRIDPGTGHQQEIMHWERKE